jgi:hypothetical protein
MTMTHFLTIYASFFFLAGLFYAIFPGSVMRVGNRMRAQLGFLGQSSNFFSTPLRIRLLGLGLIGVSIWFLVGLLAGL